VIKPGFKLINPELWLMIYGAEEIILQHTQKINITSSLKILEKTLKPRQHQQLLDRRRSKCKIMMSEKMSLSRCHVHVYFKKAFHVVTTPFVSTSEKRPLRPHFDSKSVATSEVVESPPIVRMERRRQDCQGQRDKVSTLSQPELSPQRESTGDNRKPTTPQ
jgi:hypothetical protein